MRVPRQFNVAPYAVDGAPEWFVSWLERHVQQLKRLAESLSGPRVYAPPTSLGATATLSLGVADLVQATLAANTAITIALDQRAGAEGLLELTQDATGARVPTWVNVVWHGGAAPALAAAANARTLLGFTCRGNVWIGRLVASGY